MDDRPDSVEPVNPICPPPLDESFLTALLNGIDEAVYAVDLDTRCIVYWNSGAEKIFGYPVDQALRRTTEFLQPDRAAYNRIFEIAVPVIKKNGSWRGEWHYRRRTGAIFPAEVTATLVRPSSATADNLNVQTVVVVVRDISERKELDNQIHKLNLELARRVTEQTTELISAQNDLATAKIETRLTAEQFQLLIHGITNLAILTLDRKGLITTWNTGAQSIFGYQESEIIGKPFSCLYQDSEERMEGLMNALEKSCVEGSVEQRAQLLSQSKSLIHADVVIAPFHDTTGHLLSYSVLVRDVTERLAMRKALQEKEHLAIVGTTAAMFAHEVSSPLNGISTTVQLLEQAATITEFPDKDFFSARASDLRGEIRRLQQLLDEFRLLARPKAMNSEQVEITGLVRDVIKLSVADYTRLGIHFMEDLSRDLLYVTGDADKLKQALLNLIKNAVEATPSGGTISIKAYSYAANVCLDVSDTGHGIPENINPFELFQTTKPNGTGLGLVIVQQIIATHGGTINYTTDPHQGTTFHLALPAARSSDS